jgi:hypothetical protein
MSSVVHEALKTQMLESIEKSNQIIKTIKELRKEYVNIRSIVNSTYSLAKLLPDFDENFYKDVPSLSELRTTKAERDSDDDGSETAGEPEQEEKSPFDFQTS